MQNFVLYYSFFYLFSINLNRTMQRKGYIAGFLFSPGHGTEGADAHKNILINPNSDLYE